MFIYGNENSRSIEELLETSSRIDCAVAFLGSHAEDLLLNSNVNQRIMCNLTSGATNPYVVEKLMNNPNIKIKNNPRLHAKVYIGEDGAIITSANLSANGLGLEGNEISGWLEAGYLVKDNEQLKKIEEWFEDIWSSKIATEITESDIDNAKELWDRKRINRPIFGNNMSLLTTLKDQPELLIDRNIYIVIFRGCQLGEEAEALFEEMRGNYGDNIGVYKDWNGMPENSYLIELYYSRNGVKQFNDIYRTPEERLTGHFLDENEDEHTLDLCYLENDVFGWKLNENDQNLLADKVKDLYRSNCGIMEGEIKCISIVDTRPILFPTE